MNPKVHIYQVGRLMLSTLFKLVCLNAIKTRSATMLYMIGG